MPIQRLVELAVEHAFFASGRLAGAELVPDRATTALLAGLRLTAKRTGAGLSVLGDPAAAPTLTPDPAPRLRFALRRPPPELLAETDLAPLAPGALFSDAGTAPADPLKLTIPDSIAQETFAKPPGKANFVLAARPRADVTAAAITVRAPATGVTVAGYNPAARTVTLDGPAAGLITLAYPVDPPHTPDTLATVEIALDADTLASAAAGTPRRRVVMLRPKAAVWAYYVVTNLPNPLADWRIVRAAGTTGGPPVAFADTGRAELTAADPADATGTDLFRRSTPSRVLRFVSDAPVACSETPVQGLELHVGAARLLASLPNPSPAREARLGTNATFTHTFRLITT